MLVIKNGCVHDAITNETKNVDIAIDNGKIVEIEQI